MFHFAHNNLNVLDLDRSMKFYEEAKMESKPSSSYFVAGRCTEEGKVNEGINPYE